MLTRFNHTAHRPLLARYEHGTLPPGELAGFLKTFDRCPRCQNEYRQAAATRQPGETGAEPAATAACFQPAADTLFRMHRDGVFQRRLLPPEPAAPVWDLFRMPAMRFASAAALVLLAGLALVTVREWNPAGPAVPAAPESVRVAPAAAVPPAIHSATPAAAPAIADSRPAPVPPDQAPAAVPASARRAAGGGPLASRRPIPPPTDRRGILIDSAKIVTMINYLSGNLPVERRTGLDLHPGSNPDAVDLTMMLNLSVGNDSLENLLAPKKAVSSHTVGRVAL